ncbi:putative protein [Clostridiales bacterium]|nr:putative protein [Clostridiales bacterium]
MSAEEFISGLKTIYPDFEADVAVIYDTINIKERSEAGYVTNAEIAGRNFTGRQIREALGLRSSNFTVEKVEDGIAFKTKGYGHGAGMSQYGAKYMAENGSDYLDILKHYYFDIQILTYKNEEV